MGAIRRRWADIPVAGKMFSVVAVVIAIAAGVIALALNGSATITRGAKAVYAHGVLPTQSLGRLRAQVLADRNYMLNYYMSNAEWRPKNLLSIKATDADIDKVLASYGAEAADKTTFAALEKNWRSYQRIRDTGMIPDADRNDLTNFWVAYNKGDTISGTMDKQFDSLSASQAAKADSDNIQVQKTGSRTDRVVILGGLLALAFGVLLAAFVARAVTRPLRRVTDVLAAVADGDLTREAAVDGADEVGRMAAALNQATGSMRRTVTVITASASALNGSAGELSLAGDDLARTATETAGRADAARTASGEVAGNVSTLAAAAEEMGASIREISSNASDAASVAVEAVTSARDTTQIVAKLGESSREIGDIVKVITSIAEQTNLLALNATIEAARAGDAGKGFAVVASEVKDLAQETARATEDIASRVQSIQGDTTAAVEAIERVSQVIDRISDYQTTIASAVEEQTATTAEIGRSVAEAAGGADQIAVNITYVAETAHSNSQTVDQARVTAAALSTLAAELNDAVARFTV